MKAMFIQIKTVDKAVSLFVFLHALQCSLCLFVLQVPLTKVLPFAENFLTKYIKSERKTFETGVVEAIKVPNIELHSLSVVISYWLVLVREGQTGLGTLRG